MTCAGGQENQWQQETLYAPSGFEVGHLNSNLGFGREFGNPNFLGFVTNVWELKEKTYISVADLSKCSINLSLLFPFHPAGENFILISELSQPASEGCQVREGLEPCPPLAGRPSDS